jgi:hypothetical protein
LPDCTAPRQIEGHRAAGELKDCQGEVAGLRNFTGMSSKELMKASELTEDVGRMEDLHNRMVSERNLFREAIEDRHRLQDMHMGMRKIHWREEGDLNFLNENR